MTSGCCVIFFFSSRRRHTRCGRDWSSDVCSSDLTWRPSKGSIMPCSVAMRVIQRSDMIVMRALLGGWGRDRREAGAARKVRSEERRVGKSVELGGGSLIERKNGIYDGRSAVQACT